MARRRIFLVLVALFSVSAAHAGWLDKLKKGAVEKFKTTRDKVNKSGEARATGSRSTAVVGAVRGIYEFNRGDDGRRDYAAVDRMDERSVSQSELNRFIREGGLAR